MAKYIEVVFDGPPGRRMPRFVEVEDENGFRAEIGHWFDHGVNGCWALRICPEEIVRWDPERARRVKTTHAGQQAK